MATKLEMRVKDSSHVGASICRNGRTFVHRLTSSATTVHQDEILGSHSGDSCHRHRQSDLTRASPCKMASYGERDTGTFLQQFTNSVSRALHKQTCTCNGRTYTADELRLKSNPALFAPNFLEVFHRGNDPLPLIRGDAQGATTEQKSPRALEESLKSFTKPKAKSEYEFEPLQRRGSLPRKVKRLGNALPSKRPRREVNLPEKLDVVDKSGQNWQIVQDLPSKQHKRKTSERLRPLDSSEVLTGSVTPPNSSRIKRHQGEILSKSTPGDDISNQPQNACPRELDIELERSALEIDEPKMAHYQTPTRKVLEFTESPRPNPSSVSRHMPSQTHHKPTPMPDIRKSNITYKDYRGMLASLTRDCDGDMDISTGEYTNQPSKETGCLTLPSLNTGNHSTTTSHLKKSLPLELESLYTRGSLKISTLRIDSEGTLPGDFLNRNKEELRQTYPMYDWRVANGARKLGDGNGRNHQTNGTKETSSARSTFQLPDMFPREISRIVSKRQNKKRVRNEKSRASGLDAVKEDLGNTGDATVLEQIASGQRLREMRPASGLFPRQPPPTPTDGRRKRIAETQP